MYICATSSTPLAAAMIIKGLSPGAALVFLSGGASHEYRFDNGDKRIYGNKVGFSFT